MDRTIEKSNLCKFFLQQHEIDLTDPPKAIVDLARMVTNLILSEIEIPNHKLLYVISSEFVHGLRENIPHYGIRYTEEVHNTLVEAVRQRLVDGSDIEYAWTQDQYEKFVVWKPEYLK